MASGCAGVRLRLPSFQTARPPAPRSFRLPRDFISLVTRVMVSTIDLITVMKRARLILGLLVTLFGVCYTAYELIYTSPGPNWGSRGGGVTPTGVYITLAGVALVWRESGG